MPKQYKPIILVGGKIAGRGLAFHCDVESKIFSVNWPENHPHDLDRSWFVRYNYNVRAVEGMPFLVGDFDWRNWK